MEPDGGEVQTVVIVIVSVLTAVKAREVVNIH